MCDGRLICVNCKEDYTDTRNGHGKGRCPSCYRYYSRHGVDVPPEKMRRTRATEPVCKHCKRKVESLRKLRRGRCTACYDFYMINGFDIPVERMKRSGIERPPKPTVMCKDCKERPVVHYGKLKLCQRCYQYRQLHGRKRPKYLDAETCMNCDRPGVMLTKGLCIACYNYKQRTGADRPKHLWVRQRGKYGYCDCGKPAKHKVEIQVHKHTEELPLCDDCYAIEQQHSTWYGDGPGKNWKQGKTMWGDD